MRESNKVALTLVVSKMGILPQSDHNCNATLSKSKIPDYARDYRNEYLFIRGIDNLTLAGNVKIYIEVVIMRLKMQSNSPSHEENWGKIIIYEMILSLVNYIIKYFNNPTEDNLKIVDWYFIDLIINKDKIIVRGFFYELGLFLHDEILIEGILELESRINEMNDI